MSDTQLADNHYRLAGDRLIWSGRMTVHESSPAQYAKRLRRDIARIFPQLGKVDFEYAWRGTLGNAVHRMPQIGEMQPGLWIASGFGGHGLNTTAMAGNLIARAIVEGSKTWRHFEPFELVWAGGPFGRAAAKISYLAYTAKESVRPRGSRGARSACASENPCWTSSRADKTVDPVAEEWKRRGGQRVGRRAAAGDAGAAPAGGRTVRRGRRPVPTQAPIPC